MIGPLQRGYTIKKRIPREYAKEKFVKNQHIHSATDQTTISTAHFSRLTDVNKRNEILKMNKLYNLDMERRRMFSALQTLPHNQQANLRRYIGEVEDKMFQFTRKGRVP